MSDEVTRKGIEVCKKRIALLSRSHLNEKNLFFCSNTRAVSVIKYIAAFLDWTKEETKELDHWTRKKIAGGKALHPKPNFVRIYIKR